MTRQVHNRRNCVLKHYTILQNYTAKCTICEETCTLQGTDLKEHLMQHEIIAKSFKRQCNQNQYYDSKIKGYMKKCNICDKRLNASISNVLIKHLKAKHPENVAEKIAKEKNYKWIRPYCTYLEGYKAKCKFCNKIFSIATTPFHLEKHLKMEHSENIMNTSKKNKQYSWIWQYLQLKNHKAKCNICGHIFDILREKTALYKHLIKFHKIRYSRTDKNTEKKKPIRHSRIEHRHRRTDKNTKKSKTDREMKQLVTKEEKADTHFDEVVSSFIEKLKQIKQRKKANKKSKFYKYFPLFFELLKFYIQ